MPDFPILVCFFIPISLVPIENHLVKRNFLFFLFRRICYGIVDTYIPQNANKYLSSSMIHATINIEDFLLKFSTENGICRQMRKDAKILGIKR